MARGDGIDRTNARNMRLTETKIGNTQQHNEREKDSYVNQDIVPERTPLNVHFKAPSAAVSYTHLDNSALFHPCAQPGSRSDMNVTFRTGDDALDKEFISGAAVRGLLNLKGHRVAGGMRASLYNAMPMAGVDALVDYLKQFEVEHHV